ncbi:MAG: aldehyde dehydrogenase family protein [Halioglobus sp.]|nr:aldehyde dehydrogenase family protein [Halioglobus sp.]
MKSLPEALLLINGELRRAQGDKTYDNLCPWTAEVACQAADASAADVDAAIAAARRAFDETDWSRDHERRHELVKNYMGILRDNKDRLSDIARIESGAALGATGRAVVEWALDGGDDLVECSKSITWEEDRGRRAEHDAVSDRLVLHEPLGVVGAITPWNVPLYVNVGKAIAALLAGCTVVLKSAPDTPNMGAIMGELAVEAGLPPGVFNVISSEEPAMAGELLVSDPRVDVISFTGSTGVGKRIMEAGAATLKRIFLELGGKSAKIILDDTPDFSIQCMMSMAVFHAGQGCAMPTRLLVPKSRYQEAVEALEMSYNSFGQSWGKFDDPDNVMGPVISKKQQERVLGYIKLGQEEGARLLAGGGPAPDRGDGFFVQPTCFVDVTNDMRIAQEEIFGPVLVVIPFEDDDDAIRIANESSYGLGGAVLSGDRERAMYVTRRVRAGTISVNGGLSITGDLPFGGVKGSGVGREWGREGIEEFLDTKAIAVGVPQA